MSPKPPPKGGFFVRCRFLRSVSFLCAAEYFTHGLTFAVRRKKRPKRAGICRKELINFHKIPKECRPWGVNLQKYLNFCKQPLKNEGIRGMICVCLQDNRANYRI